MAKGQRDLGRESRWREVLRRQADSGLGIRAYCRREGLPESAFHAWRRTIRERDGGGNGRRSAAQPAARPMPQPPFVPLKVQAEIPPGGGDPILIELRGGRVLRLSSSMPPAQLTAVLRAVENIGDAA